jgi:hypothetical protein
VDQRDIRNLFHELLEPLAAIEHERWSHWQQYLHSKCVLQPDGSLLIPADLVARWKKQVDAKYDELSEHEKESDREQVRKYLTVIAVALQRRTDSQ